MNVRDLKLSIVTRTENEEIQSLNTYFDNLFSDISIHNSEPNLIFMKSKLCLMKYNYKLGSGYLWCDYSNLWSILEIVYHCTYEEAQDIIKYKVIEFFYLCAVTSKYIRCAEIIQSIDIDLLTPIIKLY